VTDRTAAALASALPAGISYDTGAMGFTGERHPAWDAARIARFQANILAESGWRLVHDDDRPQTFAEHTAEALALIHDHVEVRDAD
jgi:hypothetical protein